MIVEDPREVSTVTARGNLVAVITNGTAVLGLGDIGPLAAKPVMEGKGVLFKKFAGVDVFDIEISERDPDKLVEIIASLEPSFGGINLEDIKAPECFQIERRLRDRMKIPVFHDDQHGTAIITAAAVLNALSLVNKKIAEVRVVTSGAGAAGIACLDLLLGLGLRRENVIVCDSRASSIRDAAIRCGESRLRRRHSGAHLGEAIVGADIFWDCPRPGAHRRHGENHGRSAADSGAGQSGTGNHAGGGLAARPDAIIATGRSDYPNQVNNVLCFPYIFSGALDGRHHDQSGDATGLRPRPGGTGARTALPGGETAAYGDQQITFGPEYLIPKAVRAAPCSPCRWRSPRRRWPAASLPARSRILPPTARSSASASTVPV